MPATDMELQILNQLSELQKSQNAMQVGLGQIHTSVEAVKQVIDGSAGRGPINDRVLKLESAINALVGDGTRKPLLERVWRLEDALEGLAKREQEREQERAEEERKREDEKRWFKRLIIGQVAQWLATGGGVVWLITHFSRGAG